jgi:hypothetical protein
MSNQISIHDIKEALKNEEFRNALPENLQGDVQKFLSNPNCSCNMKIYQRILSEAETNVKAFFPNKGFVSPQQVMESVMQNNWTVINCNINNLEEELKKLKSGRKQITMGRYEDQITVIVNELEMVY